MSDEEEASSSIKRRKMEVAEGENSKKVKLRVSLEETFEIELDKLTSRPDTMLGKMFTSNLAKPNECDEYELKSVSPVLFKDILNYYINSEITKQNYIDKMKRTCDYLQIKINSSETETSLYKWLNEDSLMKQGLDDLYDNYILPSLKSDYNLTTKDLIIIFVQNVYEENSELITETIAFEEETYNEVFYINHWSYAAIGKQFFKDYLRSKGIHDFTVRVGEIYCVGKWFLYEYKKDGMDYKVLKVHNKDKDTS